MGKGVPIHSAPRVEETATKDRTDYLQELILCNIPVYGRGEIPVFQLSHDAEDCPKRIDCVIERLETSFHTGYAKSHSARVFPKYFSIDSGNGHVAVAELVGMQ